MPSMSCRLLHCDGRPGRLPAGSSASNTLHWASVRSCRLVTAMVATRSPVFRFFLVDEPSTGDLAIYRSPTRHNFETLPRTVTQLHRNHDVDLADVTVKDGGTGKT